MKKITTLIFTLFINLLIAQSPGDLDTSFNLGADFNGFNNEVKTITTQIDGKILIGGSFTNYNGFTANKIIRINNDGSVDNTFITGIGLNDMVSSIALQTDGKILIAGHFTNYNNNSVNRIVRLNSDGSLDTSFSIGSGFNNYINKIIIQPDGKILVAGKFTSYNGVFAKGLTRLLDNGVKDTTFNSAISFNNSSADEILTIELQPDGRILYGGYSLQRFQRLLTNGSIDSSFNPDPDILPNAIVYKTSTHEIIICGIEINPDWTQNNIIISFDINGGRPFNGSSYFYPIVYANGPINTLKIDSNNRIIAGGNFTALTAPSSTNASRIVRFNVNGSIDSSFNNNAGGTNTPGVGFNKVVYDICIQSDNKILVGGRFDDYINANCNRIIRLETNGSVNNIFGSNIGFNNKVNVISNTLNNKILVGGDFTKYNGVSVSKIIRLNNDGTIDGSFNTGTGFNNMVNAITTQSDGKILVGGNFTSYNGIPALYLTRLNSDGTIDSSFLNQTGFVQVSTNKVNFIKLQNDGKILVGGRVVSSNSISGIGNLKRLNSDGSIDTSFNLFNPTSPGSFREIKSIIIQIDGKIVIGGEITLPLGSNVLRNIVRVNSNGSYDASFVSPSGFNTGGLVNSIHIQSDNKIIVGGQFTSYNGVTSNRIIRINSDGTIDNSFNIGSGFNNNLRFVTVQGDGKILVSGDYTSYNGSSTGKIIKLNSNGSLDNNFTVGDRFDNVINTILVQAEGKILVGGEYVDYDNITVRRINRLFNDATLSNQDFTPNNISNKFNLYPNPTTTLLNFKSVIQVEKILIYNMLGQLVQEEKVNALEGTINIEKLAQGTYLVKVNDIDKGYTIIKN
jgi:uncharacterized delta-60 repeat protein